MFSRIIKCRDLGFSQYAKGDGNDAIRAELSAEICEVAETIAANWVRFTKTEQMITAPVALKTFRHKERQGRGFVEYAWMSTPRQIYPVQGGYGFGIDASGALYDRVHRRNMAWTADVRFWMPMGNVDESRYSTGVLKGYLLPYMNDMANH